MVNQLGHPGSPVQPMAVHSVTHGMVLGAVGEMEDHAAAGAYLSRLQATATSTIRLSSSASYSGGHDNSSNRSGARLITDAVYNSGSGGFASAAERRGGVGAATTTRGGAAAGAAAGMADALVAAATAAAAAGSSAAAADNMFPGTSGSSGGSDSRNGFSGDLVFGAVYEYRCVATAWRVR